MRVTAVDHHKDLFYIEDFYPNWLLCLLQNPQRFGYKEIPVEGRKVRRSLDIPPWIRFPLHICSKIRCRQISKKLNLEISLASFDVWLDVPGYSMGKHLDHIDHVYIGLQMYLTDGLENLGTCFYNQDQSLRHSFTYKKNTGYLMINNLNQTHAMPVSVPDHSFRLSAYHWMTYDRQ